MKFVANLSVLTIIGFILLGLFLSGCSTSPEQKRTNIIQELQDAGCKIGTYSERFDRSIMVKCTDGVVIQ